MAITKKAATKLKIAGLTVLLFSGMALCGIKYYQYKTGSSLSIEQMEKYIKVADEVIEDLNQTINSEDTDPETRFEARQTLEQVIKEREDMQERLNRVQGRQNKTVRFHDVAKTR